MNRNQRRKAIGKNPRQVRGLFDWDSKWIVASILLTLLTISILLIWQGPALIGFLAAGEETFISQEVNLEFNESAEYQWLDRKSVV